MTCPVDNKTLWKKSVGLLSNCVAMSVFQIVFYFCMTLNLESICTIVWETKPYRRIRIFWNEITSFVTTWNKTFCHFTQIQWSQCCCFYYWLLIGFCIYYILLYKLFKIKKGRCFLSQKNFPLVIRNNIKISY